MKEIAQSIGGNVSKRLLGGRVNDNLGPILRWLYPGASDRDEYRLTDSGDGSGPAIASWSVPSVAQPTVASVMAQEAAWTSAMTAGGGVTKTLRRGDAKKFLTDDTPLPRFIRALGRLALAQINILRARVTAPTLPPITLAAFMAALQAEMDGE